MLLACAAPGCPSNWGHTPWRAPRPAPARRAAAAASARSLTRPKHSAAPPPVRRINGGHWVGDEASGLVLLPPAAVRLPTSPRALLARTCVCWSCAIAVACASARALLRSSSSCATRARSVSTSICGAGACMAGASKRSGSVATGAPTPMARSARCTMTSPFQAPAVVSRTMPSDRSTSSCQRPAAAGPELNISTSPRPGQPRTPHRYLSSQKGVSLLWNHSAAAEPR
jgi:hypothetical protein